MGRSTILKFGFQDDLEANMQSQLLESALRDGLTGAYNKRFFEERIDDEFHFASRHGTSLALLLLDIDHFKSVNDTHGHLAGDRVLKSFADCVHRTIRTEDVFARYGGEEFAVLLRSTDMEKAEIAGERIRSAVEAMVIEVDGTEIKVTTSVGLAGIPEHALKDSTELIESADRALYEAKRGGRNRVLSFKDVPPPSGVFETARLHISDFED